MKKVVFYMLISICLFSCKPEEAVVSTGNIYGVVTDKETSEPMRATGVELYHLGSLLLKTVTYDDGHYEFEDLEAGEYELKVVATGYEDAAYNVIVESGRTARADMQLEKEYTGIIVRTLDVEDRHIFKGEYTITTEINYSSAKPEETGFLFSSSKDNILNGEQIKAEFSSGSFWAEKILPMGVWYFQAYVKNGYGTEYGEVRKVEMSGLPIVTTLDATNITDKTATLNGVIGYEGDPEYYEKGFVFSSVFPNPTVDDPSDATTKISVPGASREFSANISGLTTNTYYARAYATNIDGTEYGKSVFFYVGNYIVLSDINLMVLRYDLSAGASWSDAQALCESSTIGGFTDWRLPTIGELGALYPKKILLNMMSGKYWTSELAASYTGGKDYYYVKYSDDKVLVDEAYYDNSLRVRAVRTMY